MKDLLKIEKELKKELVGKHKEKFEGIVWKYKRRQKKIESETHGFSKEISGLHIYGLIGNSFAYPFTYLHELGHQEFYSFATGSKAGKIEIYPDGSGVFFQGPELSYMNWLKAHYSSEQVNLIFHKGNFGFYLRSVGLSERDAEIINRINNLPRGGGVSEWFYKIRNEYGLSDEETINYFEMHVKYKGMYENALDDIFRLIDSASGSYDDYIKSKKLLTTLGGPIFDIVSGIGLLLLVRYLRNKSKSLTKLIVAISMYNNIRNISYTFTKEIKTPYIDGLGDYYRIAEMLDVPHALIAGFFTAIYVGIIGLTFYVAFNPYARRDKRLDKPIKKFGIEEYGKKIGSGKVVQTWLKDSKESMTNYVLSYFLRTDIKGLKMYEQLEYNKPELFDKKIDKYELFSELCARIFGLRALIKGKNKNKNFYSIFKEIKPLKEGIDELKDIAREFVETLSGIPFLKEEGELLNQIKGMRIATCNAYMRKHYGLKFSKEEDKENQLLLEILALKELIKARPNNEGYRKKYEQLIKADTEIFAMYSSLLEVYFKFYFHDIGTPIVKWALGIKDHPLKKLNKLVNKANKILDDLPKKISEFLKDNPIFLNELKTKAKELGVLDVDFMSKKPIPKINNITRFDYLSIIALKQDEKFMDKEGDPNYADILAQSLVTKGNAFYFADRKQLTKNFEINYKKMKKTWKKMIENNNRFVRELENLTREASKEGVKKVWEKTEKVIVNKDQKELLEKTTKKVLAEVA